jgi:proteasome lid subunit RPN8/RPN11
MRPEAGSRKLELVLPRSVQQAMVEHCARHYPKEACGVLIADASGRIARAHPMTNVEDSPIGYSMDPREQLKLENTLRQRQERLVGIYHSHTASAAYPSSVDVRLAISPDISYVLVSLQDRAQPDVKSYRIDGSTVTPEPVRVV